jgi:hypothetical protein
VFAPRAQWMPRARRQLSSGTLYLGEDGQRWLLPEEGPPEAGAWAPEGLAGVVPGPHGDVFISTTGRLYGADTPLGDLVALGPAGRARAAVAGKQHLVTITHNELRFSPDSGTTWFPSRIERHGVLTDLVMLETGEGLALGGREELFVTRDDAKSFSRVKTGPVTFTRLASFGSELRAVEADERSGDYRYRKIDVTSGMADSVSRQSPRGPLAAWDWFAEVAEVQTTAFQAKSRWLAIRARDGDTGFQVSTSPFGAPPHFRDVPGLDGCRIASQDVGGLALLASCPKSAPKAALFYASASGRELESLVLDGVSPAASKARGRSLHRLTDADLVVQRPCRESQSPLVVSTLDGQVVPVSESPCREHVAFSEPGEGEAQVCTFAEQEGLTLHSWKDRRPSLLGTVLGAPLDPIQASITVTLSGDLLVPLERRDGTWSLLRSNDGGKTFAELPLPSSAVRAVSMSGARGLLLDTRSHAFETNDGGASWHRVEFPSFARPFVLECVPEGCRTSFGFRVGWELEAPE